MPSERSQEGVRLREAHGQGLWKVSPGRPRHLTLKLHPNLCPSHTASCITASTLCTNPGHARATVPGPALRATVPGPSSTSGSSTCSVLL